MSLKAAFMFVAPHLDPQKHRAVVDSLTVVGVKDYAEGVRVAQELVADGVTVIELCGGFGNEGAGLIAKAVKGKAAVGAVRFDNHPGLGFKGGDELFG